ncbi:hypothetical protein [Gillisia sp. JM1]|uniref:hypothetical protein n=1 Tax=Gillisia sp. JM1 TaxID=1283286 RepID=UPI000409B3CC|nr:hypothetical protein [Gillisia sp. JM1]
MTLFRALSTIKKNERNEIANPLENIEVDYYFMASRFAGSKEIVSIWLWSVIVDNEGYVYAMKTTQIGDYFEWEQLIRNRISEHLYTLGVDSLIVKRLVRDIDIKKEGHIIKEDLRSNGDRIGIDGSNEIYLRKDKFSYIR